jgi:hypothetical protein
MVSGFNPQKETINATEAFNITYTGSRSLPRWVTAVCTGGRGRNSGCTEFFNSWHYGKPRLNDHAWHIDHTWHVYDTWNKLRIHDFAEYVEYARNVG